MLLRDPVGPSVTLTLVVGMLAAGAWWWRFTLWHSQRPEVKGESWAHVEEQFPMPQKPGDVPTLSSETSESVVRANPFSSKRRFIPAQSEGNKTGGGEGEVVEPPKPKFAYKGLIKLGARSRAIVEDAALHKTYFLEVGQEVAGFKVLDIAENRVVLSDLQTHEEVVVTVTSKTSP